MYLGPLPPTLLDLHLVPKFPSNTNNTTRRIAIQQHSKTTPRPSKMPTHLSVHSFFQLLLLPIADLVSSIEALSPFPRLIRFILVSATPNQRSFEALLFVVPALHAFFSVPPLEIVGRVLLGRDLPRYSWRKSLRMYVELLVPFWAWVVFVSMLM
jgi:hypothetical protein